MSKVGETGQIIFSQKNSNNYFNLVYRQKFVQKCHYWFQFGQNRSGENVPNSLIFGGKNDAICQNFGKVVKRSFSYDTLLQGVYMDEFD